MNRFERNTTKAWNKRRVLDWYIRPIYLKNKKSLSTYLIAKMLVNYAKCTPVQVSI